ncbi:hypothetical protein EYF80_054134 [Liparis tanakae]|uniref:Uncharacterized protein n=1 Tax=Liparis tanakae TaxID=230148 RepID=A0A4Z2F393_9TELE|nr:hypothetical protein EYF80_054134 [Liparis tanakae]
MSFLTGDRTTDAQLWLKGPVGGGEAAAYRVTEVGKETRRRPWPAAWPRRCTARSGSARRSSDWADLRGQRPSAGVERQGRGEREAACYLSAYELHLERQLDPGDADGASAGPRGHGVLAVLRRLGAAPLPQPGHLGQQGGALLTWRREARRVRGRAALAEGRRRGGGVAAAPHLTGDQQQLLGLRLLQRAAPVVLVGAAAQSLQRLADHPLAELAHSNVLLPLTSHRDGLLGVDGGAELLWRSSLDSGGDALDGARIFAALGSRSHLGTEDGSYLYRGADSSGGGVLSSGVKSREGGRDSRLAASRWRGVTPASTALLRGERAPLGEEPGSAPAPRGFSLAPHSSSLDPTSSSLFPFSVSILLSLSPAQTPMPLSWSSPSAPLSSSSSSIRPAYSRTSSNIWSMISAVLVSSKQSEGRTGSSQRGEQEAVRGANRKQSEGRTGSSQRGEDPPELPHYEVSTLAGHHQLCDPLPLVSPVARCHHVLHPVLHLVLHPVLQLRWRCTSLPVSPDTLLSALESSMSSGCRTKETLFERSPPSAPRAPSLGPPPPALLSPPPALLSPPPALLSSPPALLPGARLLLLLVWRPGELISSSCSRRKSSLGLEVSSALRPVLLCLRDVLLCLRDVLLCLRDVLLCLRDVLMLDASGLTVADHPASGGVPLSFLTINTLVFFLLLSGYERVFLASRISPRPQLLIR